jgi:16S rRNA (guanine966-N2)-methyltransferase
MSISQHATARRRRRPGQGLAAWSSVLLWLFHLQAAEGWVPSSQKSTVWRFQWKSLAAKPSKKTKDAINPTANSLGANVAAPEIPANLRRTVRAQRPALGHVVPSDARKKTSGGSSPSFLKAQGKFDPTASNPSRLKIAAGTARGRRLDAPNVHVRPMMGKVKEAVYSTLTAFGLYDDTVTTRHLDIFAGSGSVGLESLSRGAAHCTFVDMSRDCCACIQRNLDATGLGDDNTPTDATMRDSVTAKSVWNPAKARICCTDAFTALRDPAAAGIPEGMTFHIVTLCPPYEEIVYGDLLDAVVSSSLVQEDTVILVEYPIELKCLPPVIVAAGNTAVGVRNRRYGRTVLALYVINPTGRLPPAASSRPEEFVHI